MKNVTRVRRFIRAGRFGGPVRWGLALVVGVTGCSNPKKPQVVPDTIIEVEIAVTAQITINTLIRQNEIKTVVLEVYRGETRTTSTVIDFSETDRTILDADRIAGRDIRIVARAYDADHNLLHFGYREVGFVDSDQSRTIAVVLDWSWLNSQTAGLADDYVYAVAVDQARRVWIATHQSGIIHFNGRRWQYFTETQGLPSVTINDLICAQDNTIWAATPQGVAHYAAGTWTVYRQPDGLICDTVLRIYQEPAGLLWFGTDRGACTFDGGSWTSYPQAGPVRAVFRHPDGSVWFGTYGQGVRRMSDTTVTTYTQTDGLPSNYVWSIAQPDPGVLWFGTSLGAAEYDGTEWTAHDGDRFTPREVYAVGPDPGGLRPTWFVTAWNLSTLTGTEWNHFQPVTPFMNYNNLYIDRDNRKWFSTTGNGIILYLGN